MSGAGFEVRVRTRSWSACACAVYYTRAEWHLSSMRIVALCLRDESYWTGLGARCGRKDSVASRGLVDAVERVGGEEKHKIHGSPSLRLT